ncbi:MAG TPA: cupin domain-containing protein [Mycobacteriales bacterium]|nr:cupin domain-containing protein [Mycobacteriales bacterium]
MPVVTATDAPVFDTGGAVITGLAAPSRGAKDSAAWRVRFRPDQPSPAHELSHEEVFVVLAGAVTAVFADREETAHEGGALIVPAGTRFSLVARSGPAEAVCVLPVGGTASTDAGPFTPPWAE